MYYLLVLYYLGGWVTVVVHQLLVDGEAEDGIDRNRSQDVEVNDFDLEDGDISK